MNKLRKWCRIGGKKTGVCFPHYMEGKGEFASLFDAVDSLMNDDRCQLKYLRDIVLYNICYRDYLRGKGVDELIKRLVKEAPQLKEKKGILDELRECLNGIKIADYDIQCYNVEDSVTILGHTFNGLKDIHKHVEIGGYDWSPSMPVDCWNREPIEVCEVHVGYLYQDYPKFDSSDYLYDNRCYKNYVFAKEPITEALMREAQKIPSPFNLLKVHEEIPESQLPILYSDDGWGGYMLLATKRCR